MLRIGVDIGGTFTDFCCWKPDPEPSLTWNKVPSTRHSPIDAVKEGTNDLLKSLRASSVDVEQFLHGTTVATNAVLEQRGARIGLLMTQGFEDTLEMGRQRRSEMYTLSPRAETPAFLAPGVRRRGIAERVTFEGDVLIPLNEDIVAMTIRDLVETHHVDAIGICYLFSFINPAHELRSREIIQSLYPELPVSLSHEVQSVFREYERTCLTAFDAYLRPVISSYIGTLVTSLRQIGVEPNILTMQSRGGLASARMAIDHPVTTLLSGPAGGVVGARYVADLAGVTDCITLDMGGTSADIALITQGKPLTTTTGRIDRYPLQTPMVDVNTIGAGGGSIAWLDGARGLRVGPESAGAEPGPACYGRGGERPTVTDASFVLGYLDPAYFAGDLSLDPDASWRAVEGIAKQLGMSVPEAAHGIHRIVNARMADETRLVSVKRGHDPRNFSLILFGGGGPVNGVSVGSELGVRRLLVPFAPGALCAFGLLVSRVEYDRAMTFKRAISECSASEIRRMFSSLDRPGRQQMLEDGISPDQVSCLQSAEMRYEGQSYELEIQLGSIRSETDLERAVMDFHDLHDSVYGHSDIDAPVEIVNLRTVHVSRAPEISLDEVRTDTGGSKDELSPRRCYFPELGGFADTAVHWRGDLSPGTTLQGPAVVHQEDTTTLVSPGYICHVDPIGNLLIESE